MKLTYKEPDFFNVNRSKVKKIMTTLEEKGQNIKRLDLAKAA